MKNTNKVSIILIITAVSNAANLTDGLDGLAAGVTAIASLLFAIHAYSLGQLTVALFPLALAGVCIGFLPFNFHPNRLQPLPKPYYLE